MIASSERNRTMPTTQVGRAELPRLIMGIHPYDGCSYVDKQRDTLNYRRFNRVSKVVPVLRYAVEHAGITAVQVDHMLPILNRLHLQAVWETEQETGVSIDRIAYVLIPILLDEQHVAWGPRAHSTSIVHNERAAGHAFWEHFLQDPILKYNLGGSYDSLARPETMPPFAPKEAERFAIDYGVLEQYLGFFAGCEVPVADPGAEIDLLAMTGRFDLIREYIAFLRARYDTVITSVHHAGITIPLLEREGIEVDGYLTPVNALGAAMTPTPDIALDAIRQASKPVIAIKPLAGGRYLGHKAFEYVYNSVGVAASMFGMGTLSHIRETTRAASEVLGIGP